uniref:glutathione transferase n=1 Tax=Ananas comosus var. bracteatus TaxID=296719 RepID=A0A6V7PFL9_ANACO|nr:unnamed protein product [Ananas comosus var. bracteatus]
MGKVKVYGAAMSTNVARVIVCLEEVGAEYEVVPVDFATGEHKSPAHLARNPFGQVPAFQDGELVLFESRAISRYVLRKHKSALLKDGSLKESAMVDVWLDVEAHQYNPAVSPIIYQCMFAPMFGGVCDQKVVDASLEKLKKVLDVYEARLSKHKYLAGDFVSLADLSHFPYTHYLMGTPCKSVFDAYPHVKAWWEGIVARPAVKKAAAGMPLPA